MCDYDEELEHPFFLFSTADFFFSCLLVVNRNVVVFFTSFLKFHSNYNDSVVPS